MAFIRLPQARGYGQAQQWFMPIFSGLRRARMAWARILLVLLVLAWPVRLEAVEPVGSSANPSVAAYRSGHVLVLLSADTNRDGQLDPHENLLGVEPALRGQVARRIALARGRQVLRVKLPAGKSVSEALAENWAGSDARIRAVEPDYRLYADVIPNDPCFVDLWGLHNTGQTDGTADADVDAPEAWDITTGSSDIIIAVIDSGIDYLHDDLADNIWINEQEVPDNGVDDDGNGYVDDVFGYDFAADDNDPSDAAGHGTHVAGTIAARGNNGMGVVGLTWQCRLMACRFLDANGVGYTSDAIDAINYAVANGARILNNSWGGGDFSQALEATIAAAGEQGVLFVAAAGNGSDNTDFDPHYPSSLELDSIVSVAATDHDDQLAGFSNVGVQSVDLAGPGLAVRSTYPDFTTFFLEDFQQAAVPTLAGTQMTSQGPADRWGVISAFRGGPSNIAARADWQNSSPYLGGSDGSLLTGPLDTTGLRGMSLLLDYAIQIGPTDLFLIDVYDGTEWHNVFSSEGVTFWPLASIYRTLSVDLADRYRSAAMQLRFRWVTDAGDNLYYGVEIDNIRLRCLGNDYSEAYHNLSGTSMATPHVAAAAAMLLSQDSTMPLHDLKARLVWTGDVLDVLESKTLSGRRLNAYQALSVPVGLNVLTPNEGQRWAIGFDQAVVWTSIGGGPTVNIFLVKGNTVVELLAGEWPNNGVFNWHIDNALSVGDDYRILVDDGNDTDLSDMSFSLVKVAPVFFSDFEDVDTGFRIDNDAGVGNGLWHVSADCLAALTGDGGNHALYYGLDGLCNYNAGDTEGVVTSADISLVGLTPPILLAFDYYLHTEGEPDKADMATLEVSAGQGPFQVIDSNNLTLGDPTDGWQSYTLDVSQYAGSSIRLRWGFRTVNADLNELPGFAIDDVRVLAPQGQGPFQIDGPHQFTWCAGSEVDDCLTVSNGLAPYTVSALQIEQYDTTVLEDSLFAVTGDAQGFTGDDASFAVELPFAFPFYGSYYQSVYVCTNGFIDFVAADTAYSNNALDLISNVRIACLWDDLKLRAETADDIYIDTSLPDRVGFRYQAVTFSGSQPVNVAVVLFADGSIRFDYGEGNTSLTPTVGISAGNGLDYFLVPGYNNTLLLTNAPSVLFSFTDVSPLPPGLAIDPNTGCFTGSPESPGQYDLLIEAADSSAARQHTYANLRLDIVAQPDSAESPLPADLRTHVSPLTLLSWNGAAFSTFRLLASTGSDEPNPFSLVQLQTESSQEQSVGALDFSASLDVSPAGVLYAASAFLRAVDPLSGAVATIGPIHSDVLPSILMRSIAFAPDGTLYGVSAETATLYTIDTLTGYAQRVGTLAADVWGIDFAPEGRLYGARHQLVVIDPRDAQITATIGPLPESGVLDIDLAPDGYLYGVYHENSTLYRIDPATAAAERLASFDSDLWGLASCPPGTTSNGTAHAATGSAGTVDYTASLQVLEQLSAELDGLRPLNRSWPNTAANPEDLTGAAVAAGAVLADADITYDVYFDTVSPPATLIAADLGQPVFDPTPSPFVLLDACTTYYWQIIARNSCGQTPGAVWSFTTGLTGDLNNDDAVDLTDFAGLMHAWLDSPCFGPQWCDAADMDHSVAVDWADLILLANHWLQTCPAP